MAPRVVTGGQDPELALWIEHDPLPGQALHEDGPEALHRQHRVLSLVTTGFVHQIPHRRSIVLSAQQPGLEHDSGPGKHFRVHTAVFAGTIEGGAGARYGPLVVLHSAPRGPTLRSREHLVAITILLLLSLLAPATSPALAADAPGTATAPVVVDGVTLFRVRGLSAYPADERASVIADRIRAAAADR